MAHHTIKSPWVSINLTRLFISIRQLRAAMDQVEAGMHLESLRQRSEDFKAYREFFDGIVEELSALCDKTMKELGRVRVRFLHDLKPTDYGTDVHFFRLTDTASKDDMAELLRGAMAKPGSEGVTKMVNLDLVRDVEIRLYSNKISDIHHDYAVVYQTLQDFQFLLGRAHDDGDIDLEIIRDAKEMA